MAEFVFEDDMLIVKDNTSTVQRVHVRTLGETIDIGGDRVSNWVNHMSEKSWATNEFLYQLARAIEAACPDNDIDWEATFFIVEKEDYNSKAYALKKQLEDGAEETEMTFAEAAKQLVFDASDRSEETKDTIEQIVKAKLIKYEII